jgi:RNA polymerase sigma-70 factor (ECF subfamily)
MDSDGDLALANQIVDGDEAALAAFYALHADPLFAFIYHRMDGARLDAEDIWQEALLSAVRALPTYRGQCRLFTWLCSIARHKIADHFRRRGWWLTDAFSDLPDWRLASLVSLSPLPEEIVTGRATRARVVQALALLPEEYQKALVARYADEHSVSEVAQMLNRTYKATESLLSRARVALRDALASPEEEQE